MKIEIDQRQLLKVKFMLAGVKNGAPKAMSRSMNKTLISIGSQAAKEVNSHYNITQKITKKDHSILKAHTMKLAAGFYSTGKPKRLTSFSGTRQTKKGVSVKIRRDRPRKLLKHAFIATPKHIKRSTKAEGRGKQVFRRRYKGPRKKVRVGFSYGRLPVPYRYEIERLTGPRLQDHLGQPVVSERLVKFGGERFKVIIDQELNYELSKL